jgi:chromate transporter
MLLSDLWSLVEVFAPLSLTAFGGGTAAIPGIQEQVVTVHGWMTDQEFLNYFALSRAAPGPGSLLAALVGWHIAGVAGAVTATAAMFLPSAGLAAIVARIWIRYRETQWLGIVESAVAPLGVGLLVAAMLTLIPLTARSPALVVIGLVSALVATRFPKLHPLVILASATGAHLFTTTFFPAAG